MAGFTNRGKRKILGAVYNAEALPTNFYAALFTSATAPGADTNVKSDLTEIAAGNGYTADGISLTKNTTDFPSVTEDDTNDRASVGIKNLVWTASGGTLPASGNGARYMCLMGATGASADIWHFFDLASDRSVSSGQTLTLSSGELRLTE